MPEGCVHKRSGTRLGRWLIGAQLLIVTIVAGGMVARPIPDEPVIAIPVGGSIAPLISAGAALVGSGRIPGTVILTGPHPGMGDALLTHHILLLRASSWMCGRPLPTSV